MTLINILIMDDGDVKMAVPDGSYRDAYNALIDVTWDLIQDQDIPLVLDGPVEQHKHSAEDELVHQTAHATNTVHAY